MDLVRRLLVILGIVLCAGVQQALAQDTQSPTVPGGLTATAVSSSQINLAWTASTDNVGVTSYQVFRAGLFRATVSAPSVTFNDTGLAPATHYSYSVAACDTANNCSAQTDRVFIFFPVLVQGFNLLGNSLNLALDVMATFGSTEAPVAGVTTNVASVWKWNAVDSRWAFYAPQLTASAIASYAAANGYELLSSINPGEGYWVNAVSAMTLPAQTATAFNWNSSTFGNLPSGFNVIAHAETVTPGGFNTKINQGPPAPGAVPTGNFVSLWAWDALQVKWFYYSPNLEATGGLASVKSYADGHGYLHFQDYNKKIDVGIGFWVNHTAGGSYETQPTAVTADLVAPSVPTGLTATAVSATQVNVAWAAATDNVGVSAYQVFRGGVFRATVSAPGVTFNDTGLTSATLYSYTVAACDATGNCSAQSAATSATTLDNVPPSVPTGLSITNLTANSLTLNWGASADNVGVIAYQVYRGGAFRATVNSPTLTFNDSGLTSATNYSYTVSACDAAGNCSAQSAATSATTLDNVPPSVPAGLSIANLAANALTLNWGTSTDNVGVTAYQVFRGGVFHATISAPSVTFNDTGLTSVTLYSYSVAACDVAGNCSAQSAAASATTLDNVPPSVPAGLSITNLAANSLTLNWGAATDNVGVTAYQLYRGGEFRATVNAPTLSFSDTGLTASTSYNYTVAACDAAGNCSAQSDSAAATTPVSGSIFTPTLASGWNLMGNTLNTTLDAAAIFGSPSVPVAGVTPFVASVWKWDASTQSWAYYSPSLTAAQLTAFADSRGYQVLLSIGPGEGYWVNATSASTLPAQSGAEFSYNSTSFQGLPSSWNLIATASNESPHAFANTVSGSAAPASGVIASFLSLWAWDAVQQTWYYYAPALENALCSGTPCGLPGVESYADSRGYLHFENTGRTLGIGMGFWVNRP